MFGLQSIESIGDEQLDRNNPLHPGQMSEFQWVVEGIIGAPATHALANLEVHTPHLPTQKIAGVIGALHLAHIVHLHEGDR